MLALYAAYSVYCIERMHEVHFGFASLQLRDMSVSYTLVFLSVTLCWSWDTCAMLNIILTLLLLIGNNQSPLTLELDDELTMRKCVTAFFCVNYSRYQTYQAKHSTEAWQSVGEAVKLAERANGSRVQFSWPHELQRCDKLRCHSSWSQKEFFSRRPAQFASYFQRQLVSFTCVSNANACSWQDWLNKK